jgi:hypothetical protein
MADIYIYIVADVCLYIYKHTKRLKCNKVHSLYKMHPLYSCNRETALIATGKID